MGSPPDPARFSTHQRPPRPNPYRKQSGPLRTPNQTKPPLHFVVLFGAKDAPSQLNKIRVLSGWAVGRIGAALRVGLPSLAPGAVVRPRCSFAGGGHPPPPACGAPSPLGRWRGGGRWAPSPPCPPPPTGAGGVAASPLVLKVMCSLLPPGTAGETRTRPAPHHRAFAMVRGAPARAL